MLWINAVPHEFADVDELMPLGNFAPLTHARFYLGRLKATLSLTLLTLLFAACSQPFEEQNAFEIQPDNREVKVVVSYWQDQCESCHKTNNLKLDGNLPYWGSRSESALAAYISNAMPYGNPAICEGECAVQTARYMQAILKDSTVVAVDSADLTDPEPNNPVDNTNGNDTDEDLNDPNTPNNNVPDNNLSDFEQQCASCHKPSDIPTEMAAWQTKNSQDLVRYIELTMPLGNATACTGQCAINTAQSILAVLDNNTTDQPDNSNGDNNNSENENDTNTPSTPSEPVVEVPNSPSKLTLSQQNSTVTLTWQDNSDNETEFTLWRKQGSQAWSAYQSLAANSLTFTDKTLPAAQLSYRVSARNSAGISALSAQVDIDLSPIEGGESCSATNYQAGSAVSSGQIVENVQRYFECKAGVSAWCSSSAAWAYEPGKGQYWQEAWTELTNCGETKPVDTSPVLAAPTLISTAVNETTVDIVWLDNADQETNYQVEKSTNQGGYTIVATLPANSESYQDTSNSEGTTVQYRIRALTSLQQGTVLVTPEVTIAVSSFDAAAYYASDCASCHGARGEGSQGAKVAGFQESTLTLNALINAIDQTMPLGKVSQCQGNCAQAVGEYVFDQFMSNTTVPSAPTNVFVGANAQQTLINISWSDNADNETGFRLERAVNGASFSNWKTVAANQTSTTDNDVQLGSTYQYRVTAFNDTDVSLMAVSATYKLESNVTLPETPTQLTVGMANNKAQLSWQDNATNEDNYVVQRRKNKGNWSADIVIPANSTEYLDDNAEYGNIYEYRLLATNSAGDSSFSAIVELDLTASVNQQAYETHCAGCHKDGGIAVNLLNDFSKQAWSSDDWTPFVAKVKTMNANNCDSACMESAAAYVWSETWGYSLDQDIASTGRGVRGLRLLTSYEYLNTVRDVFGVTLPSNRLPADRQATEFKFASDAHAGVVIYDRLNEFLLLAEYVAEQTSGAMLGCQTTCSDTQLRTLLEKAFRRAIDNATLNTYKAFQSQYGREDLVASMLLSPWFLYRSELGQWDANAQAYQLTDYEIATALAFQIWGTTPDANLLSKAKQGQLSTTAQINAQAQAMMSDSKAANHLVEFVKYYTHTQANLAEKPGLTQAMISAMEQERNQAVVHALTQGSATLNELFNPGYTYVNQSLASHYNLTGVNSSAMVKVTTPKERGGLLHQGILQVHNSDFAATSLVKRGKMIRENMMCHTLGVPSGVDPATVTLPSTPISTAQRWDIITGPNASEGQCWACHQLMNEPGSVLESYDAAGRYRLTEKAYNDANSNVSIQTAGQLRSNDATEVLLNYADARELSEYLATSPVGMNCFVENYARFSTGYKADNQIKADIDQWANAFRTTGDIWALVANSIDSQSFLYKTDRN